MPKTVDISCVLYSQIHLDGSQSYRLTDNVVWIGSYDIVIDKEFVVTIDEPTISKEELMKKAIDTLKEKQRIIIAKAHKEEQELQEQINKMLVLPILNGNKI